MRRHVTVAYTLIRPHVTTAGEHPAGSDIDIMQTLSRSLGFSVNFTNEKSFSGIVEAVSSGRADMSISQAALALQRYRLGTDMLAVISKRYMLVQRHPVQINKIYTITQPLTYQVWLALLATVLSIAIFLAWLNRCYISIQHFSFKINKHIDITGIRWYTGNGGLSYQDFCISYIPLVSESVPHAWYRNKYRTPYYITLYTWLLLGTFLSMAYETNLLANLVKVDLESQPQTLQVGTKFKHITRKRTYS